MHSIYINDINSSSIITHDRRLTSFGNDDDDVKLIVTSIFGPTGRLVSPTQENVLVLVLLVAVATRGGSVVLFVQLTQAVPTQLCHSIPTNTTTAGPRRRTK